MKLRELLEMPYGDPVNNSEYSLPNWFEGIMDYEICDLSDFDISRLIRQKIIKNQILEEAVKRFFKNPLIGTYDGELLKQFANLDKGYWENNLECAKQMNKYILLLNINELDWFDEEDKFEFTNNINKLKNLIEEIK